MAPGARAAVILMVTLVLAGVCVVSGSSNRPQAQPAGATNDVCALITKEDAAAALGEAATGPKSASGRSAAGSGATVSSCEYEGSGIHSVRLTLRHFTPEMASVYRAMCEQKGKEGLTGLGDVACWYNDKHEELQVLKGTTFFSIELRRSGNPTEAIKEIARKAIARLK
jgi:hypothetical protein